MSAFCLLQEDSMTILKIAGQLISNQSLGLNESQQYAINRIFVYTQELSDILDQEEDTGIKSVRSKLIDLVTPILGYAQMLAEGWMGIIQKDSQELLAQIAEHAITMRQTLLQPQPYNSNTDSPILSIDNH